MRRLALHFRFFAFAAAMSAAMPAIARADRASTAHVQVRDGLGRPMEAFSGSAEDVSALLEFARDPQAYVPNRLAAKPPIDPSETIDKGKLAENRTKHLPVQPLRIYKNKKILVQDPGIYWVPVGTYHTEEIQVESGMGN